MVRPGFSRGPQIDTAVLGMGTHPVSHPTAARQRGAIDRRYEAQRVSMQDLFHDLGIITAAA